MAGPGTELERLVPDVLGRWIGDGCGCKATRDKMNRWGPDGCEQQFGRLTAWLVRQASVTSVVKYLPAVVTRPVAEHWLREAIHRSRTNYERETI